MMYMYNPPLEYVLILPLASEKDENVVAKTCKETCARLFLDRIVFCPPPLRNLLRGAKKSRNSTHVFAQKILNFAPAALRKINIKRGQNVPVFAVLYVVIRTLNQLVYFEYTANVLYLQHILNLLMIIIIDGSTGKHQFHKIVIYHV